MATVFSYASQHWMLAANPNKQSNAKPNLNDYGCYYYTTIDVVVSITITRVSTGRSVTFLDTLPLEYTVVSDHTLFKDNIVELPILITYLWEDGNFGCDCKRHLIFNDKLNLTDKPMECGYTEYLVTITNPITGKVIYFEEL